MPIGYYFIFKHNVLSARVRCPKCHTIGNLNVQTANSKRRFQISHLEKIRMKKCQFGYTNEFYEELEAIYEELEKKRKEGVLM